MIKNIKTAYQPDYVSPPGETLKETLETQGLSQAELAERTGRPRKTINEIIQGKASITPETAMQFELVLGIPASFWLARETNYRAWLAQKAENARLEQDLDFLKELPLKEMTSYGWIENNQEKREMAKNTLSYFGVVNSSKIPRVEETAFHPDQTYASNPWALAAWLRRGELLAKKESLPPYNKDKFRKKLEKIRQLTREEPESFLPQIIKYCAESGVAVIFLEALPQTSVSAAARWLNSSRPLIQITREEQSEDRFWLTFFHEAGHIYHEHAKREPLLESRLQNSQDHQEATANQFALDFIIPPVKLSELVAQNRLEQEAILKFANSSGLSAGLIIGCLQLLDKLETTHPLNSLKKSYFAGDCP